MNERILEIIKTLGIKKTEFAKRLNLSQPYVSELCSGKKLPSDRTIADICREFNIDENWLRTGEGEMRIQLTENAQFDLVCQELKFSGKHEVIKQILMVYWDLPDDKKDIVDKLVEDIAEKIVKGKQQKKPE
ncbi:helix-turn-helix domain-containing protein [Massilioclostridium coli]|uniref:helix-turn-helix domain-containing protein n=1 Tax=Massilioclostridium coli TaxID=1870991 RepID=UPI00085CA4C6|nr:helix-turn-helix transcriptional regulator [Massilioclostridium coli]